MVSGNTKEKEGKERRLNKKKGFEISIRSSLARELSLSLDQTKSNKDIHLYISIDKTMRSSSV
jgi:hypothetical protein